MDTIDYLVLFIFLILIILITVLYYNNNGSLKRICKQQFLKLIKNTWILELYNFEDIAAFFDKIINEME